MPAARPAALLAAALGFALAAAPARSVPAPEAVLVVRAQPGQVYEGTIAVAGQAHEFLLDDFTSGEDAVISISLKRGKDSSLEPDCNLYAPGDDETPIAMGDFRKDRSTSVAVAKLPLAGQGRHRLFITGKGESSGGYLLKVTAYPAKSFKGEGTVDAEGGAFGVTAPAESLVSLKVAPGSGSDLVPIFDGLDGPGCAMPSLVPGTKPGTATFRVPASGQYTVRLAGDGGTEGSFRWSAKVKAAKASKAAVRVNGGAPGVPPLGPAPAAPFLDPGQPVHGFASDGVDFFWREVKQTGGGGSQYRNSLHAVSLKGGSPRAMENNLGTEQVPAERCVAVAPGHVVAVVDEALISSPRAGGASTTLSAAVGRPDRVLAIGGTALVLDSPELTGYDLDGDGSALLHTFDGTCHDMAAGGIGLVYAVTNGSGNLEVRQIGTDGNGDATVAELAGDPQFWALAARGTDVYLAVDDGEGGSDVLAMSTCAPDSWRLLAGSADAPVNAMAVDELNVYLLADMAEDRMQVVQVPRGGGVPVVLARSNQDIDYDIDGIDIAAHGGYVRFLASDAGTDRFYRVKRR
jgi:hypothetical protein